MAAPAVMVGAIDQGVRDDQDGSPCRVGPRRRAFAPWCYAIALGLWTASFNLQRSVLLAWSSVSFTWVATLLVALCLVHRFGQGPLPRRATAGVLVLVVGFVPGVLRSDGAGYGLTKPLTMLSVILPSFVAAVLLLDAREARYRWLWVQAVVGLVVAVTALAFPHDSVTEPGRFTLEGLDTISTARLVGAALVASLLIGLAARRQLWWAVPAVVVSGTVLVKVGSRGPLLFAFLSLAIAILAGRCFAGPRRWWSALSIVVGTVVAYRFASVSGGTGGARLVGAVKDGFGDPAREGLFGSAFRLGLQHPLGIGWGDFAKDSAPGHALANSHGVAYAHNVFAETLCEGGWAAFLAFTGVLVLALVRLQRASLDARDAAVLGVVAFWVLNAQVSSDIIGNRSMWIALACGLSTGVDRVRRTRAPST